MGAFVAWVRKFRGRDSLEARQEAEDRARELLNDAAGSLTRHQAQKLGRLFNTDSRDGEVRHDRFSPAFHGATWDRVLENLEAFNEHVRQLWRSPEEDALRAASEIFRDKSVLPGAGRSLPTMLLYLRDPQRYFLWFNAVDRGFAALTRQPEIPRSRGLDGYHHFCERVGRFAQEHRLAPPEIDGVLALAARVARTEGADTPLGRKARLGREAFEFMGELQQNNHGTWMNENKARYKADLAEPFRSLLQSVADRHIVSLDPELITDVKTGKVLASIRRRFPDETGEYYPYYWGAFTRNRKQEDAQLYVMVRPNGLEAGVSFGAAAEDQLARVKDRAAEDAERLWDRIASIAPQLTFVRSRDPEEVVAVSNSAELVAFLEGNRPKMFRRWPPDDPQMGSEGLVDEIGECLEMLYPIVAMAWEVEPPDPSGNEVDEDLEIDEYGLADLARDTLLPAEDLEEWTGMLQGAKRQAIFYGPPGTGKTHVARALARYLAAPAGRVEIVQFHPSFSYEDFIEGLRPAEAPGGFRYEVQPGIFLSFCMEARRRPDETFVMVVDEINRADLGSVLGELLMLLEYRGERVPLPYSKKHFSIPKNVVVLATMNTADRSLALLDFALRRRFHTISLPPSREVLEGFLRGVEDAALGLELFDLIQTKVGNPDVAPGHTYFMTDDVSADGLRRIWRYELRPYLSEFWFEQGARLQELERAVGELLAEET